MLGNRSLLMMCLALSVSLAPLAARAQTAPTGYTLEVEETYTPWHIQDLEMQGYNRCLGQCMGWTRVFTFPWEFEDAPTLEMAARAIETLGDFNSNLVRAGTLTYAQFGPKIFYPFQPLHDAIYDTWWNGEPEVWVAWYQHRLYGRDHQLFVLIFPYSQTVLRYEQYDSE
ncbi:hypothetical protein ACLESO_23150 [Pyxidicoccus sp. 3LG]